MTQLFKVTINGNSITNHVDSCNVDYSVGRVFNVASINIGSLEPSIFLKKDVVITHGDNIFNGFVFSYSRSSLGLYTLNIRSNGGKLSEPFFVDTDALAEATDAVGLCSEFSALSGVSIQYKSANINFGGSWKMNGTPDSELVKLANITGADIYDDGSGIVIEPAKEVRGDAILINDDELIDYSSIELSIMNDGLGLVITKTSDAVDDNGGDIIAYEGLYGDIDEFLSEVKVYATPHGDLDSFTGVTMSRKNVYDVLIESNMLNNNLTFITNASILGIKSIKLNGVDITHHHYQYNTNVIFFDIPQSGELTVEYETKYHFMKILSNETPSGLFAHFEIIKGSQLLSWSGFVGVSNSDDPYDPNNPTDGGDSDFSYWLPDGANYGYGFELFTYGDSANFSIFSGATSIPTEKRITTTVGVYEKIESVYTDFVDSKYIFYTDRPITGVVEVRSNDVPISYTQKTDGEGIEYIELASYYPNIEITYTTDAERHIIGYPALADIQTLVFWGLDENRKHTIRMYGISDGDPYDPYDPNDPFDPDPYDPDNPYDPDSPYDPNDPLDFDPNDPNNIYDDDDPDNPNNDDPYANGNFFGYYLPDGSNYVKGFVLYTYGDLSAIRIFSGANDVDTSSKITSVSENFNKLEKVSLQIMEDGGYSFYTQYPPESISGVTSSGSDITFSETKDEFGKTFFRVSEWYPNVEILYEIVSKKHTIEYPIVSGVEQTLVLDSLNYTQRTEIAMTPSAEDWDDPSNIPCIYPTDFPFNVAELLGLEINDVSGVFIPSMGTIDNSGYVYVTITQDGIYEYDTSAVADRTSITLKANVNGSL